MLGIKPTSRNENNITSTFQEYEHIKFPVMLLRQKSDRAFLVPTRKLAVCIQTNVGDTGEGMVGWAKSFSFRGCL